MLLCGTASIFFCSMILYMLNVTRGVPSQRASSPLQLVEKKPELENIELHLDSKRGRSEDSELEEDELGDDEVGDDEVGDDEVGDDEVGDDEVGDDEGEDDTPDTKESSVNDSTSDDSVPEKLDWREKGYVTQVENQGRSEFCWAFAAAGTVEGYHMKETGQLVVLSEQNLIDCVTMAQLNNRSLHTAQCPNGNHRDVVVESEPSEHINHSLPKMPHGKGDFEDTFKYIKNYGIASNESYPFTGSSVSQCAENPKLVAATIKAYNTVTAGDEEALKKAIATYGPVAVSVDSSTFKSYNNTKGIFRGQPAVILDHAMVAVGYGSSKNGKEYWILKNSWGPNWGEEGYMRLARNKGNMCGVANTAYYVT